MGHCVGGSLGFVTWPLCLCLLNKLARWTHSQLKLGRQPEHPGREDGLVPPQESTVGHLDVIGCHSSSCFFYHSIPDNWLPADWSRAVGERINLRPRTRRSSGLATLPCSFNGKRSQLKEGPHCPPCCRQPISLSAQDSWPFRSHLHLLRPHRD